MSRKSRDQLSKDPASYAMDYLNHVLLVQSHDIEHLQGLFKDAAKAGYDRGYQTGAKVLSPKASEFRVVYPGKPTHFVAREGEVWQRIDRQILPASTIAIYFDNGMVWDVINQLWRKQDVSPVT